MSETMLGIIGWVVIIAAVALPIEWRSRRRARADVAHEISNRLLDEDDMNAALVAGESDRDKTRRAYIHRRVTRIRRSVRIDSYKALVFSLLTLGAIGGAIYNIAGLILGYWP